MRRHNRNPVRLRTVAKRNAAMSAITIIMVVMLMAIVGTPSGNLFAQMHDEDATSIDMWRNMYEGGLLSEDEYQHAVLYGTLPGGGVGGQLQDSARTEGRQVNGSRMQLSPSARRVDSK